MAIEVIKTDLVRPMDANFLAIVPAQVRLSAPSRRLMVEFDTPARKVKTRVWQLEGAPKVPGLTTELYTKAHELMAEAATILGRPFDYIFITKYPSLMQWALDPTKGKGIFNWSKWVYHQGGGFSALARINPRLDS